MIEQIKLAIQAQLPDAIIKVKSNDGVHFSTEIQDDSLATLSRIKQHQAIYSALEVKFGANWPELIHALEIKIIK